MQIGKQLLEAMVVIVGISFLLSVLGVYGTGNLPMHQRLFFWGATVATGALSGYLISPLIWYGRFSKLPGALKILATGVIVSLPVTLMLFLLSEWPSSFARLILQFGYVLLISLVISTGMYASERLKRTDAISAMASPDPVKKFMQRLPVKYHSAKLHALSAEDHYLRVHTSLGEELVLLRLSDAIKELAEANGLQVHRSWWVSKVGIGETKRQKDRLLLILHSGTEVPVSRAYRRAVKAAGFVS